MISNNVLQMLTQSIPSWEHSIFFLMGQPRPLFHLFSSFQTHITNFTTNRSWDNLMFGQVSLYVWSAVLQAWIQLFHYIQIIASVLFWSVPVLLNWRPAYYSDPSPKGECSSWRCCSENFEFSIEIGGARSCFCHSSETIKNCHELSKTAFNYFCSFSKTSRSDTSSKI